MLMLATGLWFAVGCLRSKRVPAGSALLRTLVVLTPAGFIAIELGWIVTEVGRQPWVIHGVMRTKDAVTPMPGLIAPFITFTVVYIALGAIVAYLFAQQVRGTYAPREQLTQDPHAPVRLNREDAQP
jgi:cytochrome d ubiquinol oxidase subunit I